MSQHASPAAGWYTDPQSSDRLRWWDGTAWTAHTRSTTDETAETAETADAAPNASSADEAAASAEPVAPEYPAAPTPAEPVAVVPEHTAPQHTAPQYATPQPQYQAPEYPTPQPQYQAPQYTTPQYTAPQYPTAQAQPAAYAAPAQPGGYASPYQNAPAGYGATVAAPIGAWRSAVDDRPVVTGIGSAVRTVFKKYVAFDGRASRPEYWWWELLNAIIFTGLYILAIVGIVAASAAAGPYDSPVPGLMVLTVLAYLLMLGWGLAILLPNLALTVRRLRDAGYHWALLFLGLIPFGGIAVLVLCAMPSRHP